jgi:hypothetical protein
MAIGLLVVGLTAIVTGLIGVPYVEAYFAAYFVLFVIYTWMAAF